VIICEETDITSDDAVADDDCMEAMIESSTDAEDLRE
jgi:hypothetical protein